MKFRYVGPHDAVDLADVGEVQNGKTVDVTGEAAESLSKQTDAWERVDNPKTPAKSAKNTED